MLVSKEGACSCHVRFTKLVFIVEGRKPVGVDASSGGMPVLVGEGDRVLGRASAMSAWWLSKSDLEVPG